MRGAFPLHHLSVQVRFRLGAAGRQVRPRKLVPECQPGLEPDFRGILPRQGCQALHQPEASSVPEQGLVEVQFQREAGP